MSEKTYYMVLYDNSKPKGVTFAMPSVLDKENADIMLQSGMPTVDRKANGKKYQLTGKRYFNFKNTDGTETLFIICDADEISKHI